MNTGIYDLFFFLQFITIIGIILVKMYNVMSGSELYDYRVSIVSFVGFFLAYGIGFVVVIQDYSKTIFATLFEFETWLVVLNIVLFIGELFHHIGKSQTDRNIYNYDKYERR